MRRTQKEHNTAIKTVVLRPMVVALGMSASFDINVLRAVVALSRTLTDIGRW